MKRHNTQVQPRREAATAVERADADGELTDDLVDRLRAARDAAQAGDAEVQP